MSSSDSPQLPRRTAFAGLLATLSVVACGFSPAYAPGAPATLLRNTVALDTPDTVDGFRLRDRLEARLGRAETARYTLNVTLSVTRTAAGVSRTQTTTRYNLPGTATWALRDIATGSVVADGTVDAFTAYSATGTTIATQAAATDARARLMVILADQIVARLIALAPDLPDLSP